MARKGPRGLNPEEEALWRKIAERTRPMHPERSRLVAAPTHPRREPSPDDAMPEDFRVGQTSETAPPPDDLQAPLADRLRSRPVAMDRKRFGRMKRGKMGVEARLDLHGMTMAEAHPALVSFILNAQVAGKRLVLIITGKGRPGDARGPMPVPRGVLKHQVPQWLSMPPLAQAVLQISEAHMRHGGSGAYYVYLRRLGR